MFQEFPKCLYKGGAVDGEVKIVMDAEQQKEVAQLGYLELGSTADVDAPKRRGRPPKAQ